MGLTMSTLLHAEPLVRRTQMMMGTYITLEIPESKSTFFNEGFKKMKAVEKALSSYDKTANIYLLNKNHKESISAYTYEALEKSSRYYHESDGYFNIAIGAVSKKLFHFGEVKQYVPSAKAIEEASVDFNGIHYTHTKAWLDKDVSVDLGGMGKGFGVDKVSAYFSANNIREGKVQASGDIKCLNQCSIRIQNPFGEGILATFNTTKNFTAISTSGNYERYVESTKNNHLINPKTKHSAQTFASITLVSTISNADIDAYATAASVMSYEKAIVFLEQRGVWYFLVQSDGSRTYKEPQHFIKNLRFFKP